MDVVLQATGNYPSTGNRVLLLVVNTALEAEYTAFERTLLPAVHHFGFPYRVIDLARAGADREPLTDAAAIVLAHDGIASTLGEVLWKEIVTAVRKGCGALSWDGTIHRADTAVRMFFGIEDAVPAEFDDIWFGDSPHYVSAWQEAGAHYRFLRSVPGTAVTRQTASFETIAEDGVGRPLAAAVRKVFVDEGKRYAFYFSPLLWQRSVFGHAMGLDDLLWRSLVWVARKPFAALLMPPFVTCRIDDVSGSYDHLDYVRVLNEHGWIPNLGLFLEDLDEEDLKAASRLSREGKAEISAHSFDELERCKPDQIYLKHNGEEYEPEELAEHFQRLDSFYEKWDITPSRTVNIHYDELGLNALPYLYKRNQPFTMGLIPFGVAWSANSYSWEPYPYGHQGFNYGPMEPDHRFWNVVAHHLGGYKTPDTHMGVGEFLGSCTVFAGENGHNDVSRAVDRGAAALKIGVGSRFFGTLMTHEQRIAVIPPDEWLAIVSGISERLARWPEKPVFESYDRIAAYCKDKRRTRIVSAAASEHRTEIRFELEGAVETGLSVAVFTDESEGCRCEWHAVGPFSGRREQLAKIVL
ncbi:hypothetical protein [Paenibacillus oceani]|uniref:Uncharacterized protein n=1 Tax=Paenibacillus oceani TaxID=2772510 RepID=A0A927CDQ6_9BACL|nr:hypothetical protein [Paenibacillus oceani]MBD2863935.1 hypothetical protein [Paenibacillus oceani]